jgi:hypothetical protein
MEKIPKDYSKAIENFTTYNVAETYSQCLFLKVSKETNISYLSICTRNVAEINKY